MKFGSPVNLPLLPSNAPPSPSDGSVFRVTQGFYDPDFYWRNIDPARAALGHRATDIGNFRCGAALLAMQDGTITHLRDNARALGALTDALGIRLNVAGAPIRIDYWHIAGMIVPNGATVKKGDIIALLGKTGLGNICHTHIEMYVSGVRIDPEPYLFGKSYGEGSEDMLGAKTTPVIPYRVSVEAGVSIRTDTRIADDTFARLTTGGSFNVVGHALGDSHEGSSDWVVFFDNFGEKNGLRAIHAKLVTPIGTAGSVRP